MYPEPKCSDGDDYPLMMIIFLTLVLGSTQTKSILKLELLLACSTDTLADNVKTYHVTYFSFILYKYFISCISLRVYDLYDLLLNYWFL